MGASCAVGEHVDEANPAVTSGLLERDLAGFEELDEGRAADAEQLGGFLGGESLVDGGDRHGPPVGYPARVSKTSVEIDRDIAAQAAAILGTTTLRDTIRASLVEVVNAKRRLELIALLSEEGRFDFDDAATAWGGDD